MPSMAKLPGAKVGLPFPETGTPLDGPLSHFPMACDEMGFDLLSRILGPLITLVDSLGFLASFPPCSPSLYCIRNSPGPVRGRQKEGVIFKWANSILINKPSGTRKDNGIMGMKAEGGFFPCRSLYKKKEGRDDSNYEDSFGHVF